MTNDRIEVSLMTNELSRRDLLRLSAAGVAATSLSGWLPVLASHADQSGARHKACIVLFKDGGEFKPIPTSVPGLQISEHLPKVAKWMHEGAVIRSMSTGEGAHGRARY